VPGRDASTRTAYPPARQGAHIALGFASRPATRACRAIGPWSPATGAGADEIEAIGSRNGSGTTGIETGCTDLDALAGGFYSGQLIVIAGRAAMGTTTLALDILRSATLQQGLLAALFSLGCAAWN
jgi:replicative DNA helicase